LIDELAQDERIVLVSEPELLDSLFPALLSSSIPSGSLVGDAYLAAFSMAASRTMVTFDRGFWQFKGLEVDLLVR
jgi:predicted nucleic acid-binding protein